MADTAERIGNDYHWNAAGLFLAVIMGLASVLGIWLLTGLVVMLFLL
ncbi:MAG: hypothetical protein R3297_06505 [Desulfobulbales bacterium]|nr:hypothetical protein [Desulfobulbales bacterium]